MHTTALRSSYIERNITVFDAVPLHLRFWSRLKTSVLVVNVPRGPVVGCLNCEIAPTDPASLIAGERIGCSAVSLTRRACRPPNKHKVTSGDEQPHLEGMAVRYAGTAYASIQTPSSS